MKSFRIPFYESSLAFLLTCLVLQTSAAPLGLNEKDLFRTSDQETTINSNLRLMDRVPKTGLGHGGGIVAPNPKPQKGSPPRKRGSFNYPKPPKFQSFPAVPSLFSDAYMPGSFNLQILDKIPMPWVPKRSESDTRSPFWHGVYVVLPGGSRNMTGRHWCWSFVWPPRRNKPAKPPSTKKPRGTTIRPSAAPPQGPGEPTTDSPVPTEVPSETPPRQETVVPPSSTTKPEVEGTENGISTSLTEDARTPSTASRPEATVAPSSTKPDEGEATENSIPPSFTEEERPPPTESTATMLSTRPTSTVESTIGSADTTAPFSESTDGTETGPTNTDLTPPTAAEPSVTTEVLSTTESSSDASGVEAETPASTSSTAATEVASTEAGAPSADPSLNEVRPPSALSPSDVGNGRAVADVGNFTVISPGVIKDA